MFNQRSFTIVVAAVGTLALSSASAQDLVYEPINPSFGGNPFNSSHLLAIANAQNDYEPDEEEDSDVDRFVRSLQSRLLSSLSAQVAEAIFGEDASESGRIVFGDQIIEFERTLDGITLTITEGDGSVTVVTVPYLVTESTSSSSSENLLSQTSLMQPVEQVTPTAQPVNTMENEVSSMFTPLGSVN